MADQRTAAQPGVARTSITLAARMAAIYALFGVIWILVSDRILDALVQEPRIVTQWQTIKGWLFVAVSTLLIYWLLSRADRKRRHAQAALAESERFARATLDGLAAHIAIVDEQGTILAVNKAWRNFATSNPPVTANVCEGANYLDICAVPEMAVGDEADAFSVAIRAVLAGDVTAVAIEYPCHSPQEERWFVGRITRFPGDGPPRAVIAHENITPQKQMENAIRKSELRFRHISTTISDIAYSCHTDAEGVFWLDWMTGAVEHITGYRVDEIIARDCWRSLVALGDLPEFDRRVMGLAVGVSCTCEFRLLHKDGRTIWVSSSAECVEDPEGTPVRRIYGALVDITERRAAEEMMRLQAAALQAAANGIAITDRDGKLEWVNPAFEALAGYTAAESLGRNPRDLLRSGRHPQHFYRELWETILAGNVWRGEMINRRKDGTLYHEDQTITPVLNAAGAITHFVAIKQDITHRKHGEEALRHSEASLAMAQTIAKMGSWELDFADGNATWSTSMLQLFGRKPTDPPPARDEFKALLHPDDRHIPEETHAYVAQSGIDVEVELRTDPAMGPMRTFRCTASALRNEQGRTIKVMGTMIEITERKLVEAERERLLQRVLAQADQMNQIMRCVPEGVVLLDRNWGVVMANPQAIDDLAQLAGVTCGAPLPHLGGRPLAELLTSPPAGKWHVVPWANRIYEVLARPVEEGPVPAGWVLVLRDVTEERAVEQQLQRQERLAAIGQLAAGIAHDFNNIMSVITIYAEMTAQAAGLTERERGRLATIEQQAMRATRMIRQILDFSRRSVLERQTLDLLPLMQEQQRLLEQTLPESISIRLVSEPGDYLVKGDPTRIQQLIMNLAVNARDAMPDGGMLHFALTHLQVASSQDAPLAAMQAGPWICIAVQDTGAGMGPDVLQHIFEPFFTTKAPGQGTGLGLAQVHGIVAQHDGHVAVDSQVGSGTTFTFYLPAQIVVMPSETAIKTIAGMHRGNGERLLVVEDDPALRATLVELLSLWNYDVQEASDGAQALALLAENHHPMDLILSDVVMPKLGGIGLFKSLRKRAISTPIILLTGHAMGQEVEGLTALGLSSWLAKPHSAEQLAGAITGALRVPDLPGKM